ncbi:MAG: DUF2170 family protein [Gammaproteobacteria bacterium]|nr:DUF2170 family protein [Gammaproteobacteria bacterium]
MLQILERVHNAVNKHITSDGTQFRSNIDVTSETPMLMVIREDREEFPILVTASIDQILCNTVLFDEKQIKETRQIEINEMMLQLNMAMPLSSFAKTGQYYSVFGALATESIDKNILLEIEMLSDNVIDALEVMNPFLI